MKFASNEICSVIRKVSRNIKDHREAVEFLETFHESHDWPRGVELADRICGTLPIREVAKLIDLLLCVDSCGEAYGLTDREADIGQILFYKLCERSPEAMKIAQEDL